MMNAQPLCQYCKSLGVDVAHVSLPEIGHVNRYALQRNIGSVVKIC